MDQGYGVTQERGPIVATVEAQVSYASEANLNAVFVKPQQTAELFATFGAPPAGVTAIDLVIPQIPVFEDVPLG